MNCPECGLETKPFDTATTLVGYSSVIDAQGRTHVHDDNCRSRMYFCANEHAFRVYIRRTCSVPGCGWKGKETCGCHDGPKLDAFPDPIDPEQKDVARKAKAWGP